MSDTWIKLLVALADAKLEVLGRCSPDESDISRQSCAGGHGMPILVHVRLTRLRLDNRVAIGWQQVGVANEYANIKLKEKVDVLFF